MASSVKIESANGVMFWVDESFLKRCPNPREYDVYDLEKQFKMFSYLHSTSGPAIGEGYFLLGKSLSKEDWELQTFHNKLLDIINE